MRETWVQFLSQEDPLEKEMAIYSSTLAWKIPWMEELGAGYYPWGRKESGTTERLHLDKKMLSHKIDKYWHSVSAKSLLSCSTF